MSAAEKLRALLDAPALEKYEIDLFAVLPQIVAVVEAAEQGNPNRLYMPDRSRPGCVVYPLRDALAALDEALI